MTEYEMKFSESTIGTPTMCLVQARNYTFQVSSDTFMMRVPMTGTYQALDPEFFSEKDGDFVVYDGADVNIATLSKVLFATKQYPSLESNQIFCPLKFTFEGQEVLIYGQVIQLLAEPSEEDDLENMEV